MKIPVVYSTNDNYAEYVAISAFSILDSVDKSKNNEYEINIIYTDLSIEKQEVITKSLSVFSYANVRFIDITNIINDNSINMKSLYSSHVSKEVWYRIFIPRIFKDYEKVFFIEADTIVLNDITPFFVADEKNEKMVTASLNKPAVDVFDSIKSNGFMVDEDKIFNPGVMVFNIKKCLDNKFTENCVELLNNNNFKYADEETLNIAVNGDLCVVSSDWNEFTFNFIEGKTNIIHYCDFIKPWNYLSFVEMSEKFWYFAEKSKLKDEVIQKGIKNKTFENYFVNRVIPFEKIKPKSKIIVYGARGIGLVIKKQVEILNDYTFVMQCDANYENLNKRKYFKDNNIKIHSPNDILNVDYDYIIITSIALTTSNAIKNNLLDMGVIEEKIIILN